MFTVVLAIFLLFGTLQGSEHNETTYTKESLEKIESEIKSLNTLIARWIKGAPVALPSDSNVDCGWKKVNESIAPDGILIPSAKTLEACQYACERTKDCRYFDWVPCHQLCYLSAKPTAQRYELTCNVFSGLTTVPSQRLLSSEPENLTTHPPLSEPEKLTTEIETTQGLPGPLAIENPTPRAPETTTLIPSTTPFEAETTTRTTTSAVTTPFVTVPVCKRRLDLAFVVDGSGSICNFSYKRNNNVSCENWEFNRQFIHQMIDRLVIGPDDTRVALVLFASSVKVVFDLNKYTDKDSLLSAVDNLVYPTGMTNTVGALKALCDTVFTAEGGDRKRVPNVGILITDGVPNQYMVPLSSVIDDVHRIIKMFVVGVTKAVNVKILREISSPPQKLNVTYFLAEDYSSIDLVGGELLKESCFSKDYMTYKYRDI